MWHSSHRFDRRALPLADRHYNRRKVGSPQFVPPGRCVVLLTENADALWTTSWPYGEYVRHAWPGAWVNSLFRNESGDERWHATAHIESSALIIDAVAATRAVFGHPPMIGMVTFVDPKKVPGVKRRGQMIYGYCYLKAGFHHIGFTKGGLWVWQLWPGEMPAPRSPRGQLEFVA